MLKYHYLKMYKSLTTTVKQIADPPRKKLTINTLATKAFNHYLKLLLLLTSIFYSKKIPAKR